MKIFYTEKEENLKAELFERIKSDLKRCPRDISRVLLVVPAQATLSSELEAFEHIGGKGFLTLNVVSGAKLRGDILKETGGSGKTLINSIGRGMLLRRVISSCEEELKAFGAVCKDPGFISMAADFIVQMKQNGLNADDVEKLSENEEISPILKAKLADMSIISKAYEAGLADQFEDSDDFLAFTAQKAAESEYIKTSKIYFYGFYSWTKNEIEFIKALDARACGIEIALLCGEGEEFEASRRTIAMLDAPAEKLDVSRKSERLQQGQGGEAGSKALAKTQIVSCANPFVQAESIAVKILDLMRSKGYNFSDFAVLTPSSGSFASVTKRVLENAGIKVFMDQTRGMLHNECTELLYSVLGLCSGEFRSSDIIKFVKSGILGTSESLMWSFENYVKQFHIQGAKLATPLKYRNRDFTEEKLGQFEEIRNKVASLVVPLAEKIEKAESCEEKVAVIRAFLEHDIRFPDFVQSKALLMEENPMTTEAAEETRQLWDFTSNLLDQAVQLLGPAKISTAEFVDLIGNAIPDIEEGVLPQAEDRVQIGNIGRSLVQDKKVVFVVGFCEGLVPSEFDADGIISSTEIAAVSNAGAELSKPSELLLSEELFMIFRNLNSAKELLWLGVTAGDEEGKPLQPSPLTDRIKTMAVSVEELCDIENTDKETSALEFIKSKTLAKTKLAEVIRAGLDGEEIPETWKAVYNDIADESAEIKGGLLFERHSETLGSNTVSKLYKKDDNAFITSASAMDNYASCPFKYFIQYGIGARTPKDIDIASDDMGTVYHKALLLLSEMLSKPSLDEGIAITDPESLWMTISDEDLDSAIEKILDEIAETEAEGRLKSSAADSYRFERMKKVCKDFAVRMIKQVRAGRIEKMFSEASFGHDAKKNVFPEIRVQTDAGTVYIEGKIDRIDVMPGKDDSKFIKIIDYKSGHDEFKKDLIEKGLKLQLMTYLEGSLGETENKPAGIYYFKIDEQMNKSNVADYLANELSDAVAKEIRNAHRLDGISVDDPVVFENLDSAIANGESSSVAEITVKTLKSGETKISGKLISEEEMDNLREQFKEKLEEICGRMFSGDVSVDPAPVIANTYNPCQYCELKGICLKDVG